MNVRGVFSPMKTVRFFSLLRASIQAPRVLIETLCRIRSRGWRGMPGNARRGGKALILCTGIWSAIGVTASADSLWNGSTSSWSTASNWLPGVPGSGEYAVFGNAGLPSITLGSDQTVGGIKFQSLIGFTISGNTLTIGSGGISILTQGVNFTETISSAVAFNTSSPTLDLGASITLLLSGSTITGTSFTKSGTGTLILAGAATFGSGVTVSAGTLQIGNDGTAGSLSGNIANSGTVAFNRSDALTYSGVISGGGSFTKSGAGTLTLTGANTYAGGTTISGGILQIGSGGTTGAISGNVANSGTLTFNRSDTVTYSGVISGTGALINANATGTLILTGNNSFSGTTTNSGNLQVGNGGTSGSIAGNIVTDSALTFNRSDDLSYAGNISAAGNLTKLGAGKLTLTGTASHTGGTVVSAGTLQIGNGGTTGAVSGSITNNAALIINRSDDVTYSSAITGTGSLTKLGAGKLTLTGTNTYGNGTTISAGTLQVGNGSTAGSLTGNIANEGSLIFSRSDNVTYSGNITGQGTLTKSGGGTLILTGTNTFTGATTISGGAIQIGNGGTTGSLTGNITANGVLVFNRSNAYTFSGDIGGNGSGFINQIGAGTLTLTNLASGANLFILIENGASMIYSGSTAGRASFIDVGAETTSGGNGTLTVDGASTVFAVDAMNVGTGSSGALNISNGATQTGIDIYAGSIQNSSTGTINVSGTNSSITLTGVLQLLSANGVGGAANVTSGGKISTAGFIGTGTVTLNNGTLAVTSTASTTQTISLGASGGTVEVSSGATFTPSTALSGTGALTKAGAGTFSLTSAATYSGGTAVSAGTLSLGTGGRLGSTGSYSGAISVASGATLSYANSSNNQILSGAISGSGTLAQNSTNDLSLSSSTSNSIANLVISGGRLFLNGSGALGTIGNISLTGGLLSWGNASLPAAPTTTMSFGSGSGITNRSIAAGLTLNTTNQLFPTSGTMSFNNDDQVTNPITVTGNYPTLTGDLDLQVGGTRVNEGAIGTVTFSGNVSGNGNVTKSYTGTLILTGTNTYTGTTTISGGTLQLGNATSTGSILGNVVNNGTLTFNRSGSSYDFMGDISGNGKLIQNSSVTVRLGGTNTFSGGITINTGVLTIGTGSTTGSVTSNISNNSIVIFNRTNDYTYGGNVTGGGSFYKLTRAPSR